MQLNKLVHPTLLVPDSSSRAVTILLDGLLLLSFYGTSIVSEVALALMESWSWVDAVRQLSTADKVLQPNSPFDFIASGCLKPLHPPTEGGRLKIRFEFKENEQRTTQTNLVNPNE